MAQVGPATEGTFDGLGIAPKLLEVLDRNNFRQPTPIQRQSIPVGLSGKDIMGIAQTGTGKTLAFGIPMLQRIARERCKGLVVLPTRELAVQVSDSLHKIGRDAGLKTAMLIGGENMGKQLAQLRGDPHVVIATPGRLIDHLEQKTVKLEKVGILVLDEADRMLDMGFEPQIKRILEAVPKDRQTMLFSATMPPEIVKIASKYMRLPIRVEVAPPGSTAEKVTQELFFVEKGQKTQLLKKLLADYTGSTLIFTRTKFGAKKVARSVRSMGHEANEIHSNRSLNQRLEALNGFKSGKYRVLVATDIAARGIDVTGIELVVNYDLPQSAEDYVHRIGRTARAGHAGHAVSFAQPDQRADVRDIERLIKKQLPVSRLPELPKHEEPRHVPAGRPARRDGQRRQDQRPRHAQGGRAQPGRPERPGRRRQDGQSGQPGTRRPRGRYREQPKLPSWFKGLRTSDNPTWLTLKDL